MKNSRKRIISLVLVFTLLLAVFAPTFVSANEVGIPSTVLSFTAVGTETTELSSATDVADYINSAKEAFYNALDEAQIPSRSTNMNIDPETLFSTSEPYTYAAFEGANESYVMVDGTLTLKYEICYKAYTVTVASGSSTDSNIIRKTT